MARETRRFTGRIAGFGTASETRVVVGLWDGSPFGSFSDLMVEDAGGTRTLIAPTDEIASYIASAYSFDEVLVAPVHREDGVGVVRVTAGELSVRLDVGPVTGWGRLLSAVPRPLATSPAWLALIDPVAARLMPGSRTAGTAGGDLREYYGVTRIRRLVGAEARRGDESLGALGPVSPPVRFGFGSPPAAPSIVDVVTTIR